MLVVVSLLAAGCALPGPPTYVDGWGPDACRWHEVTVRVQTQEGEGEQLQQVTLSSRGGHRIMLTCVAPPDVVSLQQEDGRFAGSVPRASYVEVRLVDVHGITRLQVDPFGLQNGTLLVRIQDGVHEVAWNGEPLEVHDIERLDHPAALDDVNIHVERALDAEGWEETFTLNSTWIADLRVTAAIQPDFDRHEHDEGLSSGGRVTLRLISPDGVEAGRLVVDGPEDWVERSASPSQVGEWRLVVHAEPAPVGTWLRYAVGASVRY